MATAVLAPLISIIPPVIIVAAIFILFGDTLFLIVKLFIQMLGLIKHIANPELFIRELIHGIFTGITMIVSSLIDTIKLFFMTMVNKAGINDNLFGSNRVGRDTETVISAKFCTIDSIKLAKDKYKNEQDRTREARTNINKYKRNLITTNKDGMVLKGDFDNEAAYCTYDKNLSDEDKKDLGDQIKKEIIKLSELYIGNKSKNMLDNYYTGSKKFWTDLGVGDSENAVKRKEVIINLENKKLGLRFGSAIGSDQPVPVRNVDTTGAAFKEIYANDMIYAINGESVLGMDATNMNQLVKGKSSITLSIETGDKDVGDYFKQYYKDPIKVLVNTNSRLEIVMPTEKSALCVQAMIKSYEITSSGYTKSDKVSFKVPFKNEDIVLRIFPRKSEVMCAKTTMLQYLILIVCPPLYIAMQKGFGGWQYIVIDIILTLLFYFPGLIYAIIVCKHCLELKFK